MKYLVLLFLAVCSVGSIWAQQQSVTIKEPAEQCYQDMKASVQVVRYDDEQMMVVSRPLLTTAAGSAQMVARVFPENNDTSCKVAVAFQAPDTPHNNSNTWNAVGSNALWQNAHMLGARIESTMKAREKASNKGSKE